MLEHGVTTAEEYRLSLYLRLRLPIELVSSSYKSHVNIPCDRCYTRGKVGLVMPQGVTTYVNTQVRA